MKIGIDLDNVLNKLTPTWLMYHFLKTGETVTVEDIKCWGMHKYVKTGKKIYDLLQPELFEDLPVMPYSQEVTHRLSKDHELFVVTATEPRNMEVKAKWLKRHFPHINQKNIVATHRKDVVDVDVLIDDAPHNILDFPGQTIVLDYAWNRTLGNEYPRAKDWKEIEYLINSLKDFYTF